MTLGELPIQTREKGELLKKIETIIEETGAVSIYRSDIDIYDLSCIPIAKSSDLLLVHYFFDFYYDGYKIIRLDDVSEARRDDSKRFYEVMLRLEGKYNELIDPEIDDLSNWQTAINQIRDIYPVCMIECEKLNNHTFIGKVIETCETYLRFQTFNSLGKWETKIKEILYENITCITFNDGYTKTFFRHLKA